MKLVSNTTRLTLYIRKLLSSLNRIFDFIEASAMNATFLVTVLFDVHHCGEKSTAFFMKREMCTLCKSNDLVF
jgi:hypothetical protein